MEALIQDIRYTVRMIGSSRGFSAAALLTIALGVGINTAVFSVVYGVLLRPLPYPEPDRLVRLSERHPGGISPLRAPMLSSLTYNAWAGSARTVEGIAAYGSRIYTVTGFDEPLRVTGASVSPVLFSLLRATPASGRFFREEEATGDADVAIISDSFWRLQYGAELGAIGRSLILDGRAYTIIGIAPPGFYFPDRDVRLWTPYAVPRTEVGPDRSGGISIFSGMARLRPGCTPAQAAAEGTAASRGSARPFAADMLFGAGGPVEVQARPVVEVMTDNVRPALSVLAAGVALILLIACANVANLMLSRGLARGRELSMRSALGAGRGRLFRQLLTESLLLATAGGIVGIPIALGLTRAMPLIAPPAFPRIADIRIDGTVFAFAAVATIVSGLLTGVAPALRSTNLSLMEAMHAGVWTSVGGLQGARSSRMRAALLVAEAALSAMLLIAAGLLIRSFEKLVAVDPGFNPANVLSARIYLPEGTTTEKRSEQFLATLLERLRESPGVTAAGGGNMSPLTGLTAITGFRLPTEAGEEKPREARALQYVVTPGYAEALGLKLLEGRFFNERDAGPGTRAMLVNREFVAQYLHTGHVVGRRFEGLFVKDQFVEIVGVVGNVLKDGLSARVQPEIYLLAGSGVAWDTEFAVVIRTSGNPLSLAPMLRSAVHDEDRSAAIDEVTTLEQLVSRSVSQPRFATLVLSVFAALALCLAAVGMYGVLSYNVTQRRREMGVRAALGATRRDLLRLVLRDGLSLTLIGLALGIGASAAVTRFMSNMLFGIKPTDMLVYGTAPLVLFAIAVLACALPARRAASADPAEALRAE